MTDQPVVTIWGTYGAGAEDIARSVATALGVPFVGQRYSSETIEAAESGAVDEPWLLRVLGSLGRAVATADGGVLWDQLADEDRDESIRELHAEVADAGGVVVGRNGTVILADLPTALHVKVDGPVEDRIAHVCATLGVDEHVARSRQAREDAVRAEMSLRLMGWDPRHNDRFDLVVNTTQLSHDQAVALIVAAQRLKSA